MKCGVLIVLNVKSLFDLISKSFEKKISILNIFEIFGNNLKYKIGGSRSQAPFSLGSLRYQSCPAYPLLGVQIWKK